MFTMRFRLLSLTTYVVLFNLENAHTYPIPPGGPDSSRTGSWDFPATARATIPYTPAFPYTVGFPGNFNSARNPPGSDWDPADPLIQATDLDQDGVYTLEINTLPIGTYEFKAALDGTWSVDYGESGIRGAGNVNFVIETDNEPVTLMYDRTDNYVGHSKMKMPIIIGDFMSVAGYGHNWNATNLAGWMKDFSKSDQYQALLHVSKGIWRYCVVEYGDDTKLLMGYAGTPYEITLNIEEEVGVDVVFLYDSKTKQLYDSINGKNYASSAVYRVHDHVVPLDPSRDGWSITNVRPVTNATARDFTIGFPGNYNAARTPAGNDWSPGDPLVQAFDFDGDAVYTLTVSTLPTRSYEFKAALDGTWAVDYGVGGRRSAGNVNFAIAFDNQEVTFLFDRAHNWVDCTLNTIPIVVGDFMEEVGYGANWDSNNLSGWMKNFAGGDTYSTKLHVPRGVWHYRIGFYAESLFDSSLGFGGSPYHIMLIINETNGRDVVFVFDMKLKTVIDSINGKVEVDGTAIPLRVDNSRPGWQLSDVRPVVFPAPSFTIGFPGNYNSARTPGGANWTPADPLVQASDDDGDGVYTLDIGTLPFGMFLFRVALDGTWFVNYGANALRDAQDLQLLIETDNEPVTLLYDRHSNFVASTKDFLPVVVGDFMNVTGYGNNWDTSNLVGWMKTFAGDDIYSTHLHVSQGIWNYAIGEYNVSLNEKGVGFVGTPMYFPLEISEVEGLDVVFVYNKKTGKVSNSVMGSFEPLGKIVPPLIVDAARPEWKLSDPRPKTNSFATDFTIGFPGNYNSYRTPSGSDWDPSDPMVQASDSNGDGVYTLLVDTLPAGSYEFKAALDGSWAVNYGVNSGFGAGNISVFIETDNEEVTFYYDRAHNFVSHPKAHLPVVVGDFMSAAGYGSNWDPNNLAGWMKNFGGDEVYSTTLKIPAGTWEYMVGFVGDSTKQIGAGNPTGYPFTLSITSNETVVTFIYHSASEIVGDSKNGYSSLGCRVSCEHGVPCSGTFCECGAKYAGPRCEFLAFYNTTCTSEIDAEDTKNKNVRAMCTGNCQPGYMGSECTLVNHKHPNNDCDEGWVGANCNIQVPLTGGSGGQLNFGQVLKPFSFPQVRPRKLEPFRSDALVNIKKWNRFWGCKRNEEGTHVNPFRWMRTYESWVYLSEKKGDANLKGRSVSLFRICGLQFSFLWDGKSRMRSDFRFNDGGGMFQTLNLGDGFGLANGPTSWTSVESNTWVHYAVVLDYEGTANDAIEALVYVNGKQVYRSKATASSRNPSTANIAGSGWLFCSGDENTDNAFMGSSTHRETDEGMYQWSKPVIDEFRIWTSARTQAEIQATMHRRIRADELERRNNDIARGIPELFFYMSMNNDMRKAPQFMSRGWHAALIENSARVLAHDANNTLESLERVDRKSDVLIGAQTGFQDINLDFDQWAIYGLAFEPSSAPVMGYEQQLQCNQDETVTFKLQAVATSNDVNEATDLSYPPMQPIEQLDNTVQSQMYFNITSISFGAGKTGELVRSNDGAAITIGSTVSVGEQMVFVPAIGQSSKQGMYGVSDGKLYMLFVTLRYDFVDTRAHGSSGETISPVAGTTEIVVKRVAKPVVGARTGVLHCSGLSDPMQWVTADISGTLGEDFTIEMWYIHVQAFQELIGLRDRIGESLFSLGVDDGSNPPGQLAALPLLFWSNHFEIQYFGADQRLSIFQAGLKEHVAAWVHMALTIENKGEGEFPRIKLYVDGINMLDEQLEADAASRLLQWKTLTLCAPQSVDESIRGFEGFVDEVRVWNVARSEEEIIELMFRELDVSSDSIKGKLTAYYQFNEASTTHARDLSGNGHHLMYGQCDQEVLTTKSAKMTCEKYAKTTEVFLDGPDRPSTPAPLVKEEFRAQSVLKPFFASPVAAFQDVLRVELSPTNSSEFQLHGIHPGLLTETCSDEQVECSTYDQAAGARVFSFQFPSMPDATGVQLSSISDGRVLDINSMLQYDESKLLIKPTSSGALGGDPFTSFTYIVSDGIHSSEPQRVDIAIKCPKATSLDATHKTCVKCPFGLFQQVQSVRTECCSLFPDLDSSCYRCPATMDPQISSTDPGTLECVCRSSGKVYMPAADQVEAGRRTSECHVCANSVDYSVTLLSCDPVTQSRGVSYNNSLKCPVREPLHETKFVDCEYIHPSSKSASIVTGVGITGCLINGLVSLWILFHLKHEVIRTSQSKFLLMYTVGASLLNIGTLSLIGENTTVSCALRVWVPNLVFTFMFSALFVKVWRVWRIFDNAQLKIISLTNWMLGKLMMKIILVDIMILSVWWIVSPSRPTVVPIIEADTIDEVKLNNFTVTICQSESEVFPTIALSYKMLILFVGIRFSWATRNLESKFSEAKYIAMSIFYMLSMGGMCFAVLTAFPLTASGAAVLQTIGFMLCTTVAVLLVIGPKMVAVHISLSTFLSTGSTSAKSLQSTNVLSCSVSPTKTSIHNSTTRVAPARSTE